MNNKKITIKNYLDILKNDFPDCLLTDEELSYVVAWDFARYLLQHYKNNNLLELKKWLNFIEDLLVTWDDYVQELWVIWFLEGIQNNWSHSKTNFTELEELLWFKSKKAWDELNAFWLGVANHNNKI